jgi:lipid II isoglutaminyl synthase (glutamine-hydrolysing)
MKKVIKIGHLYPELMNLYGDTGNVEVLTKRLEWRGYAVEVVKIGISDSVAYDIDILFSGGGQDAGQGILESDLLSKKASIQQLVDRNVPILLICGMYQMFGSYYETTQKIRVTGLDILPVYTLPAAERMVGNIVIDYHGTKLVGFENHSGITHFADDQSDIALGKVIVGHGNGTAGSTEGCRYKNIFATYMHGPVLSKNPILADEIIKIALKNKFNIEQINDLNDDTEKKAAINCLLRLGIKE